ncbi:MAG TPA: MFS transporter [Bdellovibrionota bacterium]|jgi:MFS family permease
MRKAFNLTVLVAALGYFVDMFDLTIFGVVRVASLKALGITDAAELTSHGVWLLNLQAGGMLLGGLLWGILGDKRGRLSVLFGSILLYSLANIANAFATSIEAYGMLRFLAGVGLAGELGAAVTLVSEVLSKEDRGYGTTIIAALGLLGAVAASFIGQMLDWKTAYLVGGGMGLLLLLARFQMADSAMFKKTAHNAPRGDLRVLFTGARGSRFLFCVLLGVPIYFTTGILFTFSPELTKELGISGVTAGNALLFGSVGLTLGDLASGLLSQKLKSRRKAVIAFLALALTGCLAYFTARGASPAYFYGICSVLGFACGFWAVLVTMAAEQFGTNIRATVATSVPNFVRSAVILLTTAFVSLKHLGALNSAMVVGSAVFALALLAWKLLPETYGRDLDFNETLAPVFEEETSEEPVAAT